MQRVSPRAFLLTAATAGALVAGFLVVFMLSMGSHGTPQAQAAGGTVIVNTPTATTGPTPTPKTVNNGLGALGGLFDLNAGPAVYKCMSRVDASNATATPIYVKSATVCYSEASISLGSSEPPCGAWHGPGPQPLPYASNMSPSVPGEGSCVGGAPAPAPANGVPVQGSPPPYIPIPPIKGAGLYCPVSATLGCGNVPRGTGGGPAGPAIAIAADESYQVTWFADIGTSLGLNVIAVQTPLNASVDNPGVNVSYPAADTNAQ